MSRNGKPFASLISAVFLFFITIVAARAVAAQPQTQLQLTTEVLEQSFCSIKGETSVQLKLRLHYKNLSSQRLIVYNGHDLFYQTKIRSDGAGDTQPYEVLLLNMRYFDEELEKIEARSPSRVFVRLPTGASFERELVTGIGIAGDSMARSTTAVRPGQHTLQLIVSTWYQSPKLAEKLRQQWQREGFLWSQPLHSVPLKILIEKPPRVLPCR